MRAVATVGSTIHLVDNTHFSMEVHDLEIHNTSVLGINFDKSSSGTKTSVFFEGTPRDIISLLTDLVAQMRAEHGMTETDQIEETTSLEEEFGYTPVHKLGNNIWNTTETEEA